MKSILFLSELKIDAYLQILAIGKYLDYDSLRIVSFSTACTKSFIVSL